METKRVSNIALIILAIWLLALTIGTFFLSRSVSSIASKNPLSTSTSTSAVIPIGSRFDSPAQLSSSAVDSNGKIFGKYNPEDFSYFGGNLVTKIISGTSTVLVVVGYLNLNQDMLIKATNNGQDLYPNFQMETKYVEIGKNTKITDEQGNAIKISDLDQEDYLAIIPYDATEYPAPYMLASQITVTKKVWNTGENPF